MRAGHALGVQQGASKKAVPPMARPRPTASPPPPGTPPCSTLAPQRTGRMLRTVHSIKAAAGGGGLGDSVSMGGSSRGDSALSPTQGAYSAGQRSAGQL